MKKILLLILVILVAAYVTNPDKERHTNHIYSYMEFNDSDFYGSNSDYPNERLKHSIKTGITYNNYGIYSVSNYKSIKTIGLFTFIYQEK